MSQWDEFYKYFAKGRKWTSRNLELSSNFNAAKDEKHANKN